MTLAIACQVMNYQNGCFMCHLYLLLNKKNVLVISFNYFLAVINYLTEKPHKNLSIEGL